MHIIFLCPKIRPLWLKYFPQIQIPSLVSVCIVWIKLWASIFIHCIIWLGTLVFQEYHYFQQEICASQYLLSISGNTS